MKTQTGKVVFVMYVFSALFLTGCGSSVSVKKLSDKDTGIPYYLPKPYLLITSGLSATVYQPKVTEKTTENKDGTRTITKIEEKVPVKSGANGAAYSMEIIYLPDLRDKYGIEINPGFGKSETKVTLENGWKLTSLAENTDTKVPETITATAGLVSAVGSLPILTGETPKEGAKALWKADKTHGKTEEAAECSICIYELVLDNGNMKFDLNKPVFKWSQKVTQSQKERLNETQDHQQNTNSEQPANGQNSP